MPFPPPAPDTCRVLFADSERNADMLYASGVIVPDPFIWLQSDAQTLVIVSPMEANRVRRSAREGTVVITRREAKERCGMDPKSRPSTARLIGHLVQQIGCCRCRVPRDLPLYVADDLRSQGLDLQVDDPFFPQRATKSRAEIEAVREGVQLAEAGLRQALTILGHADILEDGCLSFPGDAGSPLTAEILQGEINAEIARRGGAAAHTITACGVQGADPHLPGTGPLCAGEPIVIDIFPRVNRTGYHGDLTRTVVKGSASSTVRDAFEAVRNAQTAALAAAGPGVPLRNVHNAAAQTIHSAGFPPDLNSSPPRGFIHGTGHGLGLEVHEAPRVSDTDGALEPGNVVTIEPGIYQPEWGGIRLEDVIAITQDGIENLTAADITLEIP